MLVYGQTLVERFLDRAVRSSSFDAIGMGA